MKFLFRFATFGNKAEETIRKLYLLIFTAKLSLQFSEYFFFESRNVFIQFWEKVWSVGVTRVSCRSETLKLLFTMKIFCSFGKSLKRYIRKNEIKTIPTDKGTWERKNNDVNYQHDCCGLVNIFVLFLFDTLGRNGDGYFLKFFFFHHVSPKTVRDIKSF